MVPEFRLNMGKGLSLPLGHSLRTALEKTPLGSRVMLRFKCNICSADCGFTFSNLTREVPSCHHCASSVRLRSIVHLLSLELFGESLEIGQFRPVNKKGIGMSDFHTYADRLAERSVGYQNTFYHKEPKLDIMEISPEQMGQYDYLVTTDVLEHVNPPVLKAFQNCFKLLKRGGALIFSVPYGLEGDTLEHFPKLHDFHLEQRGDRKILKNKTLEGTEEVFDNLVFHGGDGSTLEMRVFSLPGLLKSLTDAGFNAVDVFEKDYLKYGIRHACNWSLPIVARKP